jgi:hypothetical protein
MEQLRRVYCVKIETIVFLGAYFQVCFRQPERFFDAKLRPYLRKM